MAGDRTEQAHQAAGKLAQLLAQTLVEAQPHLSEVDHREKWTQTEAWLERLEDHTKGQVTPFLQHVLDNSDPPDFIRHLILEAIDPPEQFSAILEQIFLYGIVSNVIGTSVQPFLQAVTNDLSTAAVAAGISVPVSPAVIATAAARGLNLGDPPTVKMPAWAYEQAAKSSVSKEDIDLQASIVGTPPAPQELFELLRRGVINKADVEKGLAEGDTRDDWIPQLTQLAHSWPTPLDFVRAAVQAQMSYADATEWAGKTGLDTGTALPITASEVGGSDDMFGLLWAIAGRPPGPVQLAEMTLRGIIPQDGKGAGVTSFEQGIAESDVKTKWTDALFKLAQYVPPAAAIGSLLERGGITKDQAVTLWRSRGVPDALAQAYAYIAEQQHVGQDKLLARSQIVAGYYDGILSKAQALTGLDDLGYRDDVATEILAISDFRRDIRAIDAAAKRIETLYSNYKLTAANAKNALVTIGIDPDQADRLLQTWDAVREQPIRLPTTREIGLAVLAGTITQDIALQELANLGYQARDAAIVLSAYTKKPVTPLPPAGTGIIG